MFIELSLYKCICVQKHRFSIIQRQGCHLHLNEPERSKSNQNKTQIISAWKGFDLVTCGLPCWFVSYNIDLFVFMLSCSVLMFTL